MPPPLEMRSALKSSLSKSGWCIKALNRVLTPVMVVYLCLASSLTKPGMSRGFTISTFLPPILSIIRQFTVNEKIWYSGSAVMMM